MCAHHAGASMTAMTFKRPSHFGRAQYQCQKYSIDVEHMRAQLTPTIG
jgi:hypothetical protein